MIIVGKGISCSSATSNYGHTSVLPYKSLNLGKSGFSDAPKKADYFTHFVSKPLSLVFLPPEVFLTTATATGGRDERERASTLLHTHATTKQKQHHMEQQPTANSRGTEKDRKGTMDPTSSSFSSSSSEAEDNALKEMRLRTSYSERCNREEARQVRGFVEDDVYPLLVGTEVTAEQLPSGCLLNPTLDPYMAHERHKEMVRRGEWKCTYCGKHFTSEFYVDRHLHNKHLQQLPVTATSGCLGDLCPIFGCKDRENLKGASSTGAASGAATAPFQPPPPVAAASSASKSFKSLQSCTSEEVERQNYKCKVISKRCFSGVRKDGQPVEALFNEAVCDRLRCQNGVLLGSIMDRRSLKNAANDGHGGPVVVWAVFKYLGIGIILLFVFFYALSTGLIFRTHKSRKQKKTS